MRNVLSLGYIQIFSVLKYCNCYMLRLNAVSPRPQRRASCYFIPSWMAAILQVADGVTPPSFACGRAEPPVDHSPPTLPRQTDSVCACCDAMLHTFKSSKKQPPALKGLPLSKQQLSLWLCAAFSTSVCLVRTGPPPHHAPLLANIPLSEGLVILDSSAQKCRWRILALRLRAPSFQCDKFQLCWKCLVMISCYFYCRGWRLQPLLSRTSCLWRVFRMCCIMNTVTHSHARS